MMGTEENEAIEGSARKKPLPLTVQGSIYAVLSTMLRKGV